MKLTTFFLLLCFAGMAVNAQHSILDSAWNYIAKSKDEAKKLTEKFDILKDLEGSSPAQIANRLLLDAWWKGFKLLYKKEYKDDATEEKAKDNFVKNLQLIREMALNDKTKFWGGVNSLADQSWEEVSQQRLMKAQFAPPSNSSVNGTLPVAPKPAPDANASDQSTRRLLQAEPPSPVELGLPASIDWRAEGKVTSPKNQDQCGSCWTFAGAAAVESAYLIGTGQTYAEADIDISEQLFMDCVTPENGYRSNGCDGGDPREAIQYVVTMQTLEKFKPYAEKQGTCALPKLALQDGNWIQLSPTDSVYLTYGEEELMRAVSKQPVAVGFWVNDAPFANYQGGLFNDESCKTDEGNHAMVVVGYEWTGDRSTSYWIIKNSWGADWGEGGYMLVPMDGTDSGPCGLYTYVVYPTTDFITRLA